MNLTQSCKKKILLSGWALKDFSNQDINKYLKNNTNNLLEISKDAFKIISIKSLFNLIKDNEVQNISYAGTTNLVKAESWDFNNYFNYLKIQITQAQFLGATQFRLLVGHGNSEKIIPRINTICKDYNNIQFTTEIHNGWEANLDNLKQLINKTNLNFVIDFQNIIESNLSFDQLGVLIPNERIAYFHTRNLEDIYVEDENIKFEEIIWRNNFPKCNVYWEPKRITKKDIIKYYEEYQVNH